MNKFSRGSKKDILHSVRLMTMTVVTVALGLTPLAWAEQGGGLKLPEEIAARAAQDESESVDPNKKFEIEERRIGGRLERVTVHRSNGIDEVYENREVNSMWLTEENQLGDVPNVRRWTLGTW